MFNYTSNSVRKVLFRILVSAVPNSVLSSILILSVSSFAYTQGTEIYSCGCFSNCPYEDEIYHVSDITVDTLVYYGSEINYVNQMMDTMGWKGERDADSTKLYLTIQYPNIAPEVSETTEKHPVVIQIHGGGYKNKSTPEGGGGPDSGHPSITGAVSTYARRGYVFVSLGYRLVHDYATVTPDSIKVPLPMQYTVQAAASYQAVQDLYSALYFLKENAELYGIDASTFFIQGGSAGASTALLGTYYTQELVDSFYSTILDTALYGPINRNSFDRSLIKGVGAQSGTIMFDSSMVTQHDIPVTFFQGTCDSQAPFIEQEVEYYPYFVSGLKEKRTTHTYGSRVSSKLKLEANQYYKLYQSIGGGHMLEGDFANSTVKNEMVSDSMANFFHDIYYSCPDKSWESWKIADKFDLSCGCQNDTTIIKPFPKYPSSNSVSSSEADSITFTWRSTPLATNYTIEISTDESFESTLFSDSISQAPSIHHGTIELQVPVSKLTVGDLYWKVEAFNANHSDDKCSEVIWSGDGLVVPFSLTE